MPLPAQPHHRPSCSSAHPLSPPRGEGQGERCPNVRVALRVIAGDLRTAQTAIEEALRYTATFAPALDAARVQPTMIIQDLERLLAHCKRLHGTIDYHLHKPADLPPQ